MPSQNASTASIGMLAELRPPRGLDEQVVALLSQCSPKAVQPIPTIATRSRIPLLAMVMSPLGSISRAPEGPRHQN